MSVPLEAPPVGGRSLARRLRRPVLGIGGQFLNAGTNVVTAYVASFLLRPEAFGSFVLAFGCVSMILAAGRGLLGSTVVVHLPALEPESRDALVRSAFGFTVLLGLVASVLLVPFGGVLLWFAPWITFALVQDVARYVLLADGRTGAAFVLDVAWALAQAVVIGVWVLAGGAMGVGILATAWGVGALAGASVYATTAGLRLAGPGRWVSATRDLAGWFTAVALLGAVEIYAVLVITGALLGPTDTGGLRAVQLLTFQPAMVVAGALMVLLTPAAVRARDSRTALAGALRCIALAVTPLVVLIAVIALSGGPLMGLLFAQYEAFAPVVLPIALQAIFVVVGLPATVALRALRRGRAVFLAQALRLVLLVVAAAAGAAVGGVVGLAWFVAGAALVSSLQVSVSAWTIARWVVADP